MKPFTLLHWTWYLFLMGCQTGKLLIKPDRPDAVLFSMNAETGEPGPEVGKGDVELSGDKLRAAGYVLQKQGFERVYLYFPPDSGDSLLNVRLIPNDIEMQQKLTQAQAEIEILRKSLADQIECWRTLI